jgi:hypothetical protein
VQENQSCKDWYLDENDNIHKANVKVVSNDDRAQQNTINTWVIASGKGCSISDTFATGWTIVPGHYLKVAGWRQGRMSKDHEFGGQAG